jgi:hypothetical protein
MPLLTFMHRICIASPLGLELSGRSGAGGYESRGSGPLFLTFEFHLCTRLEIVFWSQYYLAAVLTPIESASHLVGLSERNSCERTAVVSKSTVRVKRSINKASSGAYCGGLNGEILWLAQRI